MKPGQDMSSKSSDENLNLGKCSLDKVLELVERERIAHSRNAKLSGVLLRLGRSFKTLDKFSKGVDVISQSSNISLLLWGSVRLLLQILINHIDLLEKLCLVFDSVEEWLGRFEIYRSVFRASKRMQTSLGLISQDIIDLGTILFSSWDGKIKELAERISRHKELVEDDAKALAIDSDARAHVDATSRQLESKKRQIRRWLSPINQEPDYYKDDHYAALQRKTKGTCDWLCKGSMFRQWYESQVPVLSIYGKPGCGKSFLSSAIVEELTALRANYSDLAVGYFHFKHNDKEKSSSLGLVKSLVLQFMHEHEIVSLLTEIYARSVHENATSQTLCTPLWSVLAQIISKFSRSLLIIDAIDECQDTISCIRSLLHLATKSLGSEETKGRPELKVVLVSRMTDEISKELANTHVLSHSIQNEDIQQDIGLYVTSILEESPRLKRFSVETKKSIHERITERAEGMFLWVRLMMTELEKQRSQAAVERCMARLPRGLPKTYERILRDLDPDDEDTPRIFRSLIAARKPLRSFELTAFLEIHHNDEQFDKSHEIEGELSDWLFSACGQLVDIRDDKVRFIHSTVQEYLQEHTDSHFQVSSEIAHEEVALTCLTYLLFTKRPDLRRPLYESSDICSTLRLFDRKDLRFFEYASLNWVDHLVSSRVPLSSRLTEKVLSFIKQPQCLTWLEGIFRLCEYPTTYINETAARLSSFSLLLQDSQQELQIAIQKWVVGLVSIIRDWNPLLAVNPEKIHCIAYEWFPESSPFRRFLQDRSVGRITTLGGSPISRDFDNIDWARNSEVQFFHPSFQVYFKLQHGKGLSTSLCCRSAQTGLTLGRIQLEGKGHAHLESFSFSNDGRYVACLCRRQWQDPRYILFDAHLFDLKTSGSYSRILSATEWSRTSLVDTVKFPRVSKERNIQSLMEIDLLNPSVAFSYDSKELFTPGGVHDLIIGTRGPPVFAHLDFSAIKYSENGAFVAMVNHRRNLEVWSIRPLAKVGDEAKFDSRFAKIIAVSSLGQFVALWLFQPVKQWTNDEIIPRWFESVQLAIYAVDSKCTTILCSGNDVFRTSPFVGHFSDDESRFLVTLRQKWLPTTQHFRFPSKYNHATQAGVPPSNSVAVFRMEISASQEKKWVSLCTIALSQYPIGFNKNPLPARLYTDSTKIGILCSGGLYLCDIPSGIITSPILDSSNAASYSIPDLPNVWGIAISQDRSKMVLVTDPLEQIPKRPSFKGNCARVDQHMVSVPAIFEYLANRKHTFAFLNGLYEEVDLTSAEYNRDAITAIAALKRLAMSLSRLPRVFHSLTECLLRGRFSVEGALPLVSHQKSLETSAKSMAHICRHDGEYNWRPVSFLLSAKVYGLQESVRKLGHLEKIEISSLPLIASSTGFLHSLPKFSIFTDDKARTLISPLGIVRLTENHSLLSTTHLTLLEAYEAACQTSVSSIRTELTGIHEHDSFQSIGLHPLKSHRKSSFDHLKLHASGLFLGFVVSEQTMDERSVACFSLCVYSLAEKKIVWMWKSRLDDIGGFDMPCHPIDFAFHPADTLVVWAMQGMSVAVCDFNTSQSPQFLNVQGCHQYTSTAISFASDGTQLAILSEVEPATEAMSEEYLLSEASTFKDFRDSRTLQNKFPIIPRGWTNVKQFVMQITIFDLVAGNTITGTVVSAFKCPTIYLHERKLELVGVSLTTGTIVRYELDLSQPDCWRQQAISSLPTHRYNDATASVTRLNSSQKELRLLLGYWPYPNNWPYPGVGDRPIPQPVLIEVPTESCNVWSPVEGRVIHRQRQGLKRAGNQLAFHIDQGVGDRSHEIYSMSKDALIYGLERAILVRAIRGDDGYLEFRDELEYLNFKGSMPPMLFGMPDSCQVSHVYPWVALRPGETEIMSLYASGSSKGFRWEDMRTRTRRVLDGAAEPLWAIWWHRNQDTPDQFIEITENDLS